MLRSPFARGTIRPLFSPSFMLAFPLLAKPAMPICDMDCIYSAASVAFQQQSSRDCETESTSFEFDASTQEKRTMNVGAAARRSGLPAKTVRYYEEIGLIRPERAGNGYRSYSHDDVHRLAFLARARKLGFSIDDCRQLMALYQDRSRASQDVRAIATAHVTAIEEKIRELQSMRATLQKLVHACHGDERPNCPILEEMAGEREMQ
jgi:Cu(I)-responsive transcriptional regulator